MGFRILGAVLLGIVGFSTMGWAFYTMSRVGRMQRWPTTKGEIITGEAVPSESGSEFRMRVRYSFESDGQQREGTTFGLQDRSYKKSEIEQMARRYGPGRTVIVHYDPADPMRTYLDSSESQVPKVIAGIGLTLVFLAAWIAARPWLQQS